MAAANRNGKPVQVYMDEGRRARLQALADSLGHSLSTEILHAVDRHLAEPPRLETPGLTPKFAEPPPVPAPSTTLKKRGRPPKQPPASGEGRPARRKAKEGGA